MEWLFPLIFSLSSLPASLTSFACVPHSSPLIPQFCFPFSFFFLLSQLLLMLSYTTEQRQGKIKFQQQIHVFCVFSCSSSMKDEEWVEHKATRTRQILLNKKIRKSFIQQLSPAASNNIFIFLVHISLIILHNSYHLSTHIFRFSFSPAGV